MSEKFKQILEEASKQASEWPEWKKSEDLKRSEKALQCGPDRSAQGQECKASSTTAGK